MVSNIKKVITILFYCTILYLIKSYIVIHNECFMFGIIYGLESTEVGFISGLNIGIIIAGISFILGLLINPSN